MQSLPKIGEKDAMDLEDVVVFILICCDSKVRPIKLIPGASII